MINYIESRKRICAMIPIKNNSQLLKLWKSNTIGASKSSDIKLEQHLLIVAAVEQEWNRRIKELLESEAFKWPSTDVSVGSSGGNYVRQDISDLKLLGYTVGQTDGLLASARRLILDLCFMGQLPPFDGVAELAQWPAAKSKYHLTKIFYNIAELMENLKRMPSRGYHVSLTEWEDDLKYLREEYYVGFFRFAWHRR